MFFEEGLPSHYNFPGSLSRNLFVARRNFFAEVFVLFEPLNLNDANMTGATPVWDLPISYKF